MKATFYQVDGTVSAIEPKNGTDFQLEELQQYVGGYIEIVSLGKSSKIIVVNEEGKLDGLKYNEKATEEWAKAFPPRYFGDDYIAGDAVICESEMVK